MRLLIAWKLVYLAYHGENHREWNCWIGHERDVEDWGAVDGSVDERNIVSS